MFYDTVHMSYPSIGIIYNRITQLIVYAGNNSIVVILVGTDGHGHDNIHIIVIELTTGEIEEPTKTRTKSGREKGKKWYIPRGTQSPNTGTHKEVEEGDL